MSESIEVAPTGRRARKKERTRRDLYDAAMRLFLARGFDAVTIDDICRAADVARATFFLHFPTKDALLVEYGERATEELAARLRERRRSAVTDLRLALDFLTDRARRDAEVVQLTVREVMARPAALAETTERTRDFVQLLGAVVRRGQAAGELRRGVAPELAGATIAAAYLSIVAEWTRRRQRFDLRATVEQALDVILHGLVHRQRRKR
jgi:AcrR family transcriptional regulator